MSRTQNLSLWINVVSVTIMLVAWLVLAPVQLGGSVGYIIITGNSMEPHYFTGDLVVVRKSDTYRISDIVAYHHPDAGVIIHRIIDEKEKGYVMRGDNNSWLDSYYPSPSEIIGKAQWHLPGAGKILEQIRNPSALASATVLLGGSILLTTIIPSTPNGAAKRKRRTARRNNLQIFKHLNANQETFYFAMGVLALVSVLLGIVAFTRPITQTVSKNVPFEHRGKFTYAAPAAPNVYDAESVRTGDPIFRQLTNVVKISFDYQVISDALKSAKGSYRLLAEISDSTNNWKRTLELQPPAQFTNGAFRAEGTLDLNKIQELVKLVNQQTGINRSQYAIVILPEVMTQLVIGDQTLDERFAPRLEFRVNELEMYLVSRASSGNTDPLKPVQAGLAHQSVTQPNTLSFFGMSLEIGLAQGLSIIGSLTAMLGILVLWTLQTIAAASGEASLIQLKYGGTMISVDSEDPTIGQQAIDVTTIDDLAKIAEHEGRMMLHGFYDNFDQYFVTGETVVYRYAPKGKARVSQGSALSAPEQEAFIESWVRTLTLRQIEDRTQLFKMADLTVRLARKVGVPESQLTHIRWGVLLHDIGQIALTDQVWLKPDNLTEDDWRLMRAHPTFARDMLAPTPALQSALEIPYMHHERWDGSGYPSGLQGEAIPFAARLFAVVDVWVAMRSMRAHRPAYSDEEARHYLQEQSGKQFDSRFVTAFLELDGI